ncbi:MAG: thiamine pyrophosphate-binding protein [Candidatus Abyssubacteria bacterium]
MSRISGGALAAQVLKNDGAKNIFGLVGGHIHPLFEGCAEMGIRVVDVRHEESAAHMAEGWALATGQPGICTGTAGPGFTNLLTGIANSFSGATPLLAIGGRASINQFDTGALQDFNQLDIVKPMTKFARAVYQLERIPEYIAMGLRHAASGRPGPAYIEIPRDLMEGEMEVSSVQVPECHRIQSPPAGNPREVERAVALMERARKPVMIAGGGVWWSQAQEELKQFIEKAEIPLYTRSSARGSVPDDHPLCMGGGFTLNPAVASVLSEADLVILLGTRFTFTFSPGALPPFSKIIRVDIEPSEICAGHTPDVGIVGDAKMVLRQFTDGIKKMSHKEWIEQIRSGRELMRQMAEPMLGSDQVPIHPLRVCREITNFLDRETVICTDGGDICIWGNLALPAKGPGLFISQASSIFGCLGVGIPYGLAAKLANPNKRVLVLTGDGSFGLTMMELDTALRHNVPFVVVIANDSCWGNIHRPAREKRGQSFGCELAFRRYDKLVEDLGGHGEFVERPEEIGPAIRRAIDSGLPACVNIVTDPEIGPTIGPGRM